MFYKLKCYNKEVHNSHLGKGEWFMNKEQLERIQSGKGFIAALDQSGGSTPKALATYGVS